MGRMTRVVLLVMMLLCAGVVMAFAAEPSTEPILRIDPGMHTAMINRIATDAAGRFLVTASDDKSLRVWELSAGRLIRTIRPPAGEGHEGKLFSVALSPDGKTIATGGWTQFNNGKKTAESDGHVIYLFDRTTGEMTGRINGVTDTICHLAYSPDGRWLAATLGRNGIRIYRTSDFSLAAEDREYGSDSYSAHFSRSGHLVTTCYDGFVRLYEAGPNGWGASSGQVATLSPRCKVKAPDGEGPFAVRFSPDGSKIAVGYFDTAQVTIFSGRNLSAPVTLAGSHDNGNQGRIAWSLDGRFLYAGGQNQKQINGVWTYLIRRWNDGGRGAFIDIPAGRGNIMELAPLPDGSVVFGSVAPDFGVISPTGKRTLFVPQANADFRDNNYEGFLLAPDASRVRFGFESFGKAPALFDLTTRQLTLDANTTGLSAPLTALPGMDVTEWKNTYSPKLNGKPLKLDEYERSRSLALAPDSESFVLGAEWYLRCFDKKGNPLWEVQVPAVVWGVNIPANGKVVVAAFGDGTIRWYRLKDGKELLAFFPHADRKRWVLWTPSGYYDASVGGEDLIGWQVNRGKDKAADFFPASRFRDTYYRPDIVARVLATPLDEAEAVRQANAARGIAKEAPAITKILPPVIEIIDIPNGTLTATSKTITIRYKVRAPADAPAKPAYARVNARPIPTPKGAPAKVGENDIQEITVTIPEEDCEISLITENKHSQSIPATVRVLWKGKLTAQKQLPRLLILAVGINNYDDNSLKKLDYAAKDAADFVAALEKQKGVLYSDIIAKSLSTGRASLSDIKKDLEWLKKEATNSDIAIVFISGHGANDPPGSTSGIYHLVPSDGFVKELTVTSLEFSTLENVLGALPSKVLVFLDSCHSGGAYLNRNINELNEKGIVVFASSTGIQQSLEDNLWKNGAFTLALVEGLNGKADLMGDGEITISSLDTYISNRVGKLTGGQQTPVVTKKGIPDFSIARKKQ